MAVCYNHSKDKFVVIIMFEIQYTSSLNPTYLQKDPSRWFIVDNCYDPYTRMKNISHIRQNHVTRVVSKDDDLSYLYEIPEMEGISCSRESNHLEALYCLKDLKILSLATDDLSFDFAKLSPKLKTLVTEFEKENKSWMNHASLTGLVLKQYATPDLSWAYEYANRGNIKALEIDSSYAKFKDLKGLEAFTNLEFLCLSYCRQLREISPLYELKHLKVLHWHDNPKVPEPALERLQSLEELYLVDREREHRRKIPTISFVKEMPNLKIFETDRKVEDRNLKPLRALDMARIFDVYTRYNVRIVDCVVQK